jgi:dedicated sortase system histidine kinase
VTLRRQLLVASLLLLCLPWAGCEFIREMEGALRQGQEQSLQATSMAVAAVLKDKPTLLYPNLQRLSEEASDNSGKHRSLYAIPVEQNIIIDGYGDGWEELDFQQFESASDDSSLNFKYKAATKQGRLFLFLQIEDDDVVFHNPAISREPNGDRLLLRTWLDGRRQDYVIATAAPGRVTAKYANRIYASGSANRIRGQWQDTAQGYNLELELPLSITGGRLGFYIINAASKAGAGVETLGNTTALDMAPPPWLIYSTDSLQQAVAPFLQSDRQLQVVDKTHWLLSSKLATQIPGNNSNAANASEDTFWLMRVIYRSILSHEKPQSLPPVARAGKLEGESISDAIAGTASSSWHQNPDHTGRTLLSAASPIMDGRNVVGAVIISQSSEKYLSLTDQAFSRLLGYSLLALCVGVFGLLGFASILSWRIRKLSRAASVIVREDGSLADDFPRSAARDEIGELSRRYADMLDKLREYNNYLRTLSRKLSHELRTPIAVIQTSLENLEQQNKTGHANNIYINRARKGLARLNKILTAMSEANRLEESIHNNEPMEVALGPLLQDVFTAYQQLYKNCHLKLETPPEQLIINAVPELIVQALDKLMENAASFCPEQGDILLALHPAGGVLELSVTNDGPLLPEEFHSRLFDSMVSLRPGSMDEVHMGLGLYIVRLIAEFHGGAVRAENLANKTGVIFTITLPCLSARDLN